MIMEVHKILKERLTGFLKNAFVQKVGMCVCACVRVHPQIIEV